MATDNVLDLFDFGSNDTPEDITTSTNQEPSAYEIPLDGGQIGTIEPIVPEPSQNQGNAQPDNWEVRARYFQSEHDKAMARYNEVAPIAAFLAENPEAVQVLTEYVSKGAKAKEETNVFTLPSKPVKPANFNLAEAYSDENSDSYKFLVAQTEYTEKLAEYQTNFLAKEQERIQQEQAARQAQIEYNKQLSQVSSALETQFGMNKVEIADFINEMQNENSLSLQNLVMLYKIKKNPNAFNGQKQTPQQQKYPTPAVMGGGGTPMGQQSNSPSDMFLSELAGFRR